MGSFLTERWKPENKEEQYHKYVRQVVLRTQPDLILVTGDIVYGEFDDDGSCLLEFIEFMDSFKIPWAPVMGNHELESKMGADWQCEQLENSQYGLFKQRTLTGNGNYNIGIRQNDKLVRTFYMLDSNGSAGASAESLHNDHSITTVGFGEDQIQWYTDSMQAIKAVSPDTKFSMAFHIQLFVFEEAYSGYGYAAENLPIDVDTHPNKQEGDFGYLGRPPKSAWDDTNEIFDGIKALGVDSIFVGHEHCNSASIVYDGIRLQYGQKSSTYDRANYRKTDGTIVGSYLEEGTPIVGGTFMLINEQNGLIDDAYIVLYDSTMDMDK